ncbi:receptor-type guanylate cyclase gcy-17-like [Gigantopelta aegis]|uniref:receptor-type guanylate cyclase gcy-17-like n=1 Tax=Gigantopelta aegis TaxID=1735272 RepID=UPI001B8894BA|nr:receptor-type guanylate cyclase gcy-17-like [Gigantopelta aegis]
MEPFIEWFYDAISESRMTFMWKILVSYNKIVTSMEQIGMERALGVVFYVNGSFPSQDVYETYNMNVNVFKSNYRSAVTYWNEVDAIFQKGVSKHGTNLTAVIEKFRYEIQHSVNTKPSVLKAQWWFDNMTLYLDSLLVIQEDLALVVNNELEASISGEERKLIICIIVLVVDFLVCPVVIMLVRALTRDIQTYAQSLVTKTRQLHRKMKAKDNLLYQMVPKPIAEKLKSCENIEAEYFKAVTIMFSEIEEFTDIVTLCTPFQIVHILNSLYTAFDEQLANHEVYKVETINDSYMVVSGLSMRIKEQHAREIANLALDFQSMTRQRRFITHGDKCIELKIGINTGPCMAGIVGTIRPRYCLFGDTVNTASRMKSYGMSGRIHLSASTFNSLMKTTNMLSMTARDPIVIKGKGIMQTYWLNGHISGTTGDNSSDTTFHEGDSHLGV